VVKEDAADYQKVPDIALSLEGAEKSVQVLWSGAKLNKMGSGIGIRHSGWPQLKGEGGASPCYSCGSTNHMASSATSKKPSATIVVRKAMLEGHAEADQRHH